MLDIETYSTLIACKISTTGFKEMAVAFRLPYHIVPMESTTPNEGPPYILTRGQAVQKKKNKNKIAIAPLIIVWFYIRSHHWKAKNPSFYQIRPC